MYGLKLKISSLFMCLLTLCCVSPYGKREPRSAKTEIKPGVKLNLRESKVIPEEKTNTCVCSKVYDPVCGSNNKSYYNICQLQCENKAGTVDVLHQGNCIPF